MRSRSLALGLSVALVAAACAGSDDDAEAPDSGPATTVGVEEPEPLGEDTAEEPEPESDDGTAAESTSTIEESPAVELNFSAQLTPAEHAPLAASVDVTAQVEFRAMIRATSGDHVVETPLPVEASTEQSIPVIGMRSDRTYTIDVIADGDDLPEGPVVEGLEFTTPPLPDYFGEHQLTIDAERAAPGFTIVEFDTLSPREGARSSQHLVAYDNDGEIVWYYENTGALAGFELTPRGTFNIFYWPFGTREVDFLGNVVGNWRPLPNGADEDVITNETLFEGIDPEQVQFQGGLSALLGNPGDAEPTPIVTPWVELDTIHHEAWPMPDGNTLTMSTTVHELTPEQREAFCPDDPAPFNAISDVIVEFAPDGTTVRTWDLWDVIDIDLFPGGEMCVPAGIFAEPNARDWNHANSATYDPVRDAVLVSSRHTNQIIAFDHLDDEGPQSQLRWILGDGATMPLDGEPTTYQHAVEVNADGSIVVYDNGNDRPSNVQADPTAPPTACTSVINCEGAYSRAVIYDVDDSSDDPADWSATQRWEHIDTEPNGNLAYSAFISDADVLSNGNVLVTHGGIGTFPPTPDDPLHILIREVVPEGDSGGEVVWELQSDLGFVSYRAERIETFYNGPTWES